VPTLSQLSGVQAKRLNNQVVSHLCFYFLDFYCTLVIININDSTYGIKLK